MSSFNSCGLNVPNPALAELHSKTKLKMYVVLPLGKRIHGGTFIEGQNLTVADDLIRSKVARSRLHLIN